MDSAPACGREPAAPPSSVVVTRAANVSASERFGFVSLRGRDGFRKVYHSGRRHQTPGLTVISCRTEDPGPPQVGIVASRRVGGAVQRNRAKRRLREAMRHVALRPGTAYVVQAKRSVLGAPFSQLVAWLRAATGDSPGEPRRGEDA